MGKRPCDILKRTDKVSGRTGLFFRSALPADPEKILGCYVRRGNIKVLLRRPVRIDGLLRRITSKEVSWRPDTQSAAPIDYMTAPGMLITESSRRLDSLSNLLLNLYRLNGYQEESQNGKIGGIKSYRPLIRPGIDEALKMENIGPQTGQENAPEIAALNTKHVCTVTGLALALYQEAQQRTRGQARRSAECLCSITSLELDGCHTPQAVYITLILMVMSDLAAHAPNVKIVLSNWSEIYHVMARNSGEFAAQELMAALTWAGWRWNNIQKC